MRKSLSILAVLSVGVFSPDLYAGSGCGGVMATLAGGGAATPDRSGVQVVTVDSIGRGGIGGSISGNSVGSSGAGSSSAGLAAATENMQQNMDAAFDAGPEAYEAYLNGVTTSLQNFANQMGVSVNLNSVLGGDAAPSSFVGSNDPNGFGYFDTQGSSSIVSSPSSSSGGLDFNSVFQADYSMAATTLGIGGSSVTPLLTDPQAQRNTLAPGSRPNAPSGISYEYRAAPGNILSTSLHGASPEETQLWRFTNRAIEDSITTYPDRLGWGMNSEVHLGYIGANTQHAQRVVVKTVNIEFAQDAVEAIVSINNEMAARYPELIPMYSNGTNRIIQPYALGMEFQDLPMSAKWEAFHEVDSFLAALENDFGSEYRTRPNGARIMVDPNIGNFRFTPDGQILSCFDCFYYDTTGTYSTRTIARLDLDDMQRFEREAIENAELGRLSEIRRSAARASLRSAAITAAAAAALAPLTALDVANVANYFTENAQENYETAEAIIDSNPEAAVNYAIMGSIGEVLEPFSNHPLVENFRETGNALIEGAAQAVGASVTAVEGVIEGRSFNEIQEQVIEAAQPRPEPQLDKDSLAEIEVNLDNLMINFDPSTIDIGDINVGEMSMSF